MDQTRIYFLDPAKRFLHSPFAIEQIGWMPHHICYHCNNLINALYVCICSNQESCSETQENGVSHSTLPNPLPHIGFVLPGTLKNTIRASYHDELFFRYPADAVSAFCDLFGVTDLDKAGFHFSGIPKTVIAELRYELEHADEPGVPDLLDQLAIQLFTRILIEHKKEQQGNDSLRLKLYSIASELNRGKPLRAVLKQTGISERTFYREWGKAFPVSPKEYLLQYRLENACNLLKETDLAPGEIAEKCGFSSTVYFYQVFRKRKGMSPGTFRREKQNLFSE